MTAYIIEIDQDSDTIDCAETDPSKRSEIAENWRQFMRAYLARVFDVPAELIAVRIGPGMTSEVWAWPDDGVYYGPTAEEVSERVEKHGYEAWLKSL